MSCSTNQCCAVSDHNTRCLNLITYGGNHCEFHRPKATSLYLKYKELSKIFDLLDINKPIDNTNQRINHIMKCYSALDKTFNARLKHRRYAFVPEFYDEGHDYQFTILKERLDECETILSELYLKESLENVKEDEVESADENVLTIPQRIKKCNKRRRDTEENIESWINKYIEENHEIINRKYMLMNNIIILVLKLYDEYNFENAFPKCVMVYHLVITLIKYGYLSKDHQGKLLKQYVPSRCGKDCKCDGYEALYLQLVCSCIRENNTIAKFLNLASEDGLKMLFGTLIFNKDKILPLIEDIKSLYMVHEAHTMYLKLYLSWNPLKSRLEISQNFNREHIPSSSILAVSRLKKKHQAQQIKKLIAY
jgi:hypothetical protein